MKVPRPLVLLAALACSPTAAQVVVPELLKPENRTVSTSRQITVFGGTRAQRSDLARRAEELKEGLQRELQDSDAWTIPVLVVLTPGDGVRLRQSPVLLQVFDGGDAGRKIQLEVAPGLLADPGMIDRGLLRALLLERSLRRQKFEGDRFVEPPDWLASALASALSREPLRDASLYDGLLGTKAMPRLDRFLRQNGATLRGRAREMHAAQSLALYRGLLELPDGRRKIVENLTLVEPARDPLQRFGQTWPDLADDPPRLARLWAVSVARLSTPRKLELFGADETGRRLEDILQAVAANQDGQAPDQVLLFLSRRDEGRFRLSQAARETQQLVFRAHPLYAPLVEEYRTMLDDLSRNRRRGFVARFGEAEDLRAALDTRSGEITDFMNWYQANEPHSAAWPERVSVPPRSAEAVRRNDAISRFIDSVEQRGW